MRYIQYIVVALIFLYSAGLSNSTYASLETSKSQILKMKGGAEAIERIDAFVLQLAQKARKDTSMKTQILNKIDVFQEKYQTRTNKEAKTILTILEYFQAKIEEVLAPGSSRLLERLQKVETDTYKSRASSRTNQLKQKKYTRIPIKK